MEAKGRKMMLEIPYGGNATPTIVAFAEINSIIIPNDAIFRYRSMTDEIFNKFANDLNPIPNNIPQIPTEITMIKI